MAAKKKSTAKKAKRAGSKSPAKKPAAKKPAAKKPTPKKGKARPEGRSNTSLGYLVAAVAVTLTVIGVVMAQRPGNEAESAETVSLGELAESTGNAPQLGTVIPDSLRVQVHAEHPHQRDAFTQGLLWHEGKLYESTGLEGRSSLRRVDLETGAVERRVEVGDDLFAEGLARVGNRLYQLTWQSELLRIYDADSFELVEERHYEGEGWGLCFDGTHLVMSNGSARLSFRDPETFDIVREVEVTKAGRPVRWLNELECVDGQVYANVWQTNEIVRIDPRGGQVNATIDASALVPQGERRIDVLNGIAWLPERQRFALTGKLWPTLFEVTFEER